MAIGHFSRIRRIGSAQPARGFPNRCRRLGAVDRVQVLVPYGAVQRLGLAVEKLGRRRLASRFPAARPRATRASRSRSADNASGRSRPARGTSRWRLADRRASDRRPPTWHSRRSPGSSPSSRPTLPGRRTAASSHSVSTATRCVRGGTQAWAGP